MNDEDSWSAILAGHWALQQVRVHWGASSLCSGPLGTAAGVTWQGGVESVHQGEQEVAGNTSQGETSGWSQAS